MGTAAARSRRGQSGLTMLELLLALVLAAMLIAPLVMWATFALRQQPVTRSDAMRVAGSALLFHHFPKDVTTAGAAAIDEDMVDRVELAWNYEDCLGGAAASDVVLVLVRGGSDPSKIVYSETASSEPAVGTLWRRECSAEDGSGTESVRLIGAVARGSTSVTCSDAAELVPCRHVELRTTPTANDKEVVLVGTRRVDLVAVQHYVSDNRVPIARIEIDSQALVPAAGGGYPVTLSSAASRDPDGQIVCYQWVFPTAAWGSNPPAEPERVTIAVPPGPVPGAPAPDPDHSWCPDDAAEPIVTADRDDPTFHVHERLLPTPGVYYVELTVTDDKGHSSTNYKRIEVFQPDPVAMARTEIVTGGTPGATVIELAARWVDEDTGEEIGSHHPDGTIASYEWVVVAAHGGPESAFLSRREGPDGADPWYLALPEWIQGSVLVRLTVTDTEGRTAQAQAGVPLDWDPPPPLEPDENWTPPVRVDPPPPPTGGTHDPPTDLRFAERSKDDATWQVLEWTPPAEVDRYRVEMRHRGPGCDVLHVRIVEPAETPSHLLHPSLCPRHPSAVSEVRVGAELEDRIGWSGWVTYEPGAYLTDPNILEPDEGD